MIGKCLERGEKEKENPGNEIKDETIYRGVVKCCSGNGLLRTGGPQATASLIMKSIHNSVTKKGGKKRIPVKVVITLKQE